MEKTLTIHIMADSCNGEEKEFAQYCRDLGYVVTLHRESGLSPETDAERELGNQLWESYSDTNRNNIAAYE